MRFSTVLLVTLYFLKCANTQSLFCGTTSTVPSGSAAPALAHIYNNGSIYRISIDNLTSSNSAMLPTNATIKLATSDSTQCPVSKCLMNLATNQKSSDWYTALSPTTPMYCARIPGDCGATVPIYRYFALASGFLNGIDYAYSFDGNIAYADFLRELLPICYGWSSNAMVTSLIEGSMVQTSSGFTFVSSVTLVQDTGYNIIVDTPTASDSVGRDQMLNALTKKGLTTSMINNIVTTHGHPDHNGQDNIFSSATQYYNSFVITTNNFAFAPFVNGSMQLSPNVKLWMTPGHTPQDLSAIISNVPNYGTVAIVGDLIFNADDVSDSTFWQYVAWNATAGMANRYKVICAADYIVPGHGAMFQVTDAMNEIADC